MYSQAMPGHRRLSVRVCKYKGTIDRQLTTQRGATLSGAMTWRGIQKGCESRARLKWLARASDARDASGELVPTWLAATSSSQRQ